MAVKILAEEHEFVNRLADISANSIGSPVRDPPPTGERSPFPASSHSFMKKWPNISIELCDKSSSEMEEMLCNGELDLFIGVMYQDNPKLDSTPLLNDHIYMVCSDHLLKNIIRTPGASEKPLGQGDRSERLSPGLPFLLPHPSMKLRKTIDQCFLAARVKPKIFLESQSTELFISLFPYDYRAFFCTRRQDFRPFFPPIRRPTPFL